MNFEYLVDVLARFEHHLADSLGVERVVHDERDGQPAVGQQQVVQRRGQVVWTGVQSHVVRRYTLPTKSTINSSD